MKFDIALAPTSLAEIPQLAQRAETLGVQGVWTTETQHDPFLPHPLIAAHTTHLEHGTAVAIAFARSPMTVAHTAWDLAAQSNGRFILGLGTQVKPHIEKRFGMTWPESPVGKFREFIQATRAVWQAWQRGDRLNHRGDHFKLTLMTPFFNPGAINHPNIPIYIAGVNSPLIKLAGECADGFHVHPHHSRKYLAEVVLPNIEEGAKRTGRTLKDVTIACTSFVALGDTEAERSAMREAMRSQIAFYASTPTYHSVMGIYGWDKEREQLTALASRGQWAEMTQVITDEMLAEFLLEGTWAEMGGMLKKKYEGLADRVSIYLPFTLNAKDEDWKKIVNSV
jgi:probable F420-dependent oxidoreductase